MSFAAAPRLLRAVCAHSSPLRSLSSGAGAGSAGGKSGVGGKQAAQKPAEPKINENVPGLSERCVLPHSQPLGPGASSTGEYKVPEYFCYNKTSYTEAEIEMASYRCPQPDANRKL